MRKIWSMLAGLVVVAGGISFLTVAPASAATAAQAKPAAVPCTTSVEYSKATFTFNINVFSNICDLPSKAAAECVFSIYQGPYASPYVYTGWAYGDTVIYGPSQANCGPLSVQILHYGYDTLNNGVETYHGLG